MCYKPYKPTRILVEASVEDAPLSRKVLQAFPEAEVATVTGAESLIREIQSGYDHEAWRGALLLARQKGPFIKPCPGTSQHICCLYKNLNVAMNCDLDCTYCILQSYLNNPLITLYVNTADLWDELDQFFRRSSNRLYRIGTGELTDSLTFDHFSSLNADLVGYFSDKQKALLELKTKTDHVDGLLGLEHGRRTVLSWSLNAETVAATEESKAPSLERRLAAAEKAQEAGYRLGFHFDPMIWHEDWEEGYQDVVDRVFAFARPENIAWISLGALRYPPSLDERIRTRHPESRIVLGELLPGKDGKLRYFEPLRVEMFHKMYKWIKEYSRDVFVYLCMESDEVWRKSFGWSPGRSVALARLLDERVKMP